MKKWCAVVLALVLLVSSGCAPKAPYEATYTELGIPAETTAVIGTTSCCAWDVEVYENALFVGSGDYDKNHGPVGMWQYDLKTGEWLGGDEKMPDEQVSRFYVFDDKLYAPGTDPKDSWDLGNYYTYTKDDGKWTINRVLPGGVHNFDLIKFDGKLFAGLGVTGKDSPIVMSTDEKTWTAVPMYKDGKLRERNGETYIRVYDFFVLDNTLYAYFYLSDGKTAARELYRYDGENFVYHSDMIATLKFKRQTYEHIAQKMEFKGCEYIVNGNLYKTSDMITAEMVDMGEGVEVQDARVIGKTLYLLCNELVDTEDGETQFRVSVKKSKDGETFTEAFYFSYPVRALSFTYHNKTFYFGTGFGTKGKNDYHFENGTILSVDYRA